MPQKLTNYYQVMIIKHLSEHKKIWFCFALSWTILIAFLCLVKDSDLPSIGIKVSGLDKVVHFGFHFIFILLWAFYFFASRKVLTIKLIATLVFCSFIFGVSIELLQGIYTTTRQADVFDVLSNTFGALVAGSIASKILKKQSN
jgi:hypothetical protein